jgi:hypothetical protein
MEGSIPLPRGDVGIAPYQAAQQFCYYSGTFKATFLSVGSTKLIYSRQVTFCHPHHIVY